MSTEASNDNTPPGINPVLLHKPKAKFIRKRKFKKRVREKQDVTPRQPIKMHESEGSLCTSIWRSVIIQALYDIVGEDGSEKRKSTRAEANAWFSCKADNDNIQSDFEFVCELANLQPEKVLKVVEEVREKGEEVIEGFNFRTIRKSSSSREGRRRRKKA